MENRESKKWCKCLSRTSDKTTAISQAKDVGEIQKKKYIVSEVIVDGQKEYHIGLTRCNLSVASAE